MTHISSRRHVSSPTLTQRLANACRDPRYQRALVLAANVALVACALAEPFTASLALHLVLLPINAWQLMSALRASSAARPCVTATVSADATPTRQKAASMRYPVFDASLTAPTVRLSPRAAR